MIDDLQVGDLIINNEIIRKVLVKLEGVVLLSCYAYRDDIETDNDLKRASCWYTDFELKKDGWKKYTPEEVKEVTMDEVCEKFGHEVKIKKE